MSLRICAIMTIRNEELYIEKCLGYLIEQGISVYLIDNESSDKSVKIASKFLGKGLIAIETYPYNGYFNITDILKNEERIMPTIDTDWFIHHDADEIREAPEGMGTLKEAIEKVNSEGYNAINSDEFVFLPVSKTENFENSDYYREMKHYYYFHPKTNHRLNCWKKTADANLSESGGHRVKFANLKVYPKNFIIRHYIFLSHSHGIKKYALQEFPFLELLKGRSHDRFLSKNSIILPPVDSMKTYDGTHFDKSDPYNKHFFLGSKSLIVHIKNKFIRIPLVLLIAFLKKYRIL